MESMTKQQLYEEVDKAITAASIDVFELTKDINTISDVHLIVGATVTDGNDVGKYASGMVDSTPT